MKLADFGSAWRKDKSFTDKTSGATYLYLSPELRKAKLGVGNYEPFSSDVFSLGLTFLHIAGLVSNADRDNREQQIIQRGEIEQEIGKLAYSNEFKSLLLDMLQTLPHLRPSLEEILRLRDRRAVNVDKLINERDYRQAADLLKAMWEDWGIAKLAANAAEILFMRLGSNEEAQSVIQAGLHKTPSDLSLLLAQAGLFFFTGEKKKTIKACEELFQLGDQSTSFTAQLYLCEALYWDDDRPGLVELNQRGWKPSAVLTHLEAHIKCEERNFTVAEGLRKKLASIAAGPKLPDILQALNLYHMAGLQDKMNRNAEAAETYSAAQTLFAQSFPRSLFAAKNLMNWAIQLNCLKNKSEAVAKHAEAAAILTAFPNSLEAALNQMNWGVVEQAAERYLAAETIFAAGYTNSIERAKNLYNWVVLLKANHQFQEAHEKCVAAEAILAGHYPDNLLRGKNLMSWGELLRAMGQRNEAAVKHESANTLLSSRFPISLDTARNRIAWAVLLQETEHTEAVLQFAAADELLTSHFPDSWEAALNLVKWGNLLRAMIREDEALHKLVAAERILAEHYSTSLERASTLRKIGQLMQNSWPAWAAAKYEAACNLLDSYFPQHIETAFCLCVWGRLLESTQPQAARGKWTRAKRLFRTLGKTREANRCREAIRRLAGR